MSEWQDIETAPKDGTAILAWPIYGMYQTGDDDIPLTYALRWSRRKNAWVEAAGEEYACYEPTHWRPMLPPPPDTPKRPA